MQNWPGNWLLFGDFNVVRRKEEIFNSQFCEVSARDFNRFIHEAGVQDFNMGGERFTYMSRVDAKLSKIDRFLACSNFLSSSPNLTATALPRHLSDHSPITLTVGRKDFGPKPFRFFNSWLLVDGIDQVVVKAWSEFRGYGPADAFLAAKLKFVKEAIRQWRKLEYSKEVKEKETLKDSLGKLRKRLSLECYWMRSYNTGAIV